MGQIFLTCKCEDWRQKNIDQSILLCFTQGKSVNVSRAKTKEHKWGCLQHVWHRTMDEWVIGNGSRAQGVCFVSRT